MNGLVEEFARQQELEQELEQEIEQVMELG